MQVLTKRTTESLWYDFDCTDLLGIGETISSVSGVTADQAGLTFGSPVINNAPITYKDGRTAAIGCVARVQITGGTVQLYTVRALMVTSAGNTREASGLLDVSNTD